MKKLKITQALVLALFLCSFGISPVFAAPKIVVGANLKEYKHPTKKECDIVVSAKQYPTIQAGIDAATPGDTVCVGAGTFNENVRINKSIRLSGRGAFKSIIGGQVTDEVPGWFTIFITANKVTLEGFTIKGVGNEPSDTTVLLPGPLAGLTFQYNRVVAGNGELALRADGNNHTNELIQNNIFEGNNSPQIAFVGGGENVDFLNNSFFGTISNISPFRGGVLFDGASNSTIKHNAFNATGTISVIVMTSWTNTVNKNNLNSNTITKVSSYPSGGTLNAENNWWGDLEPSDNIQGDIDYMPFADKPFKQKKY